MKGAFMGVETFQKNNEHRWRAVDGEHFAGEVTSAVYPPRLACNIGFIRTDLAHLPGHLYRGFKRVWSRVAASESFDLIAARQI